MKIETHEYVRAGVRYCAEFEVDEGKFVKILGTEKEVGQVSNDLFEVPRFITYATLAGQTL